MPADHSDQTQLSHEHAVHRLLEILRLHGGLGPGGVRAALKAQRIYLSAEQVLSLETDSRFRLDERGRLFAREAPSSVRSEAAQQPPAVVDRSRDYSLRELATLIHVSELDVLGALHDLAVSRLGENWSGLELRLTSGGRARLTEATLAGLAARSATISLRNSLDAEQRRLTAERDVLQEQLKQVASSQEFEQHPGSHELDDKLQERRMKSTNHSPAEDKLEKALATNLSAEAELATVRAENTRLRQEHQELQEVDKHPGPAQRSRHELLRWRPSEHGCRILRASEPVTPGERRLGERLALLPTGLVILNCIVVNGSQERELDALVIHPMGIFTSEQKDTSRSGLLEVPANGPPTVDGEPIATPEARTQARQQAQIVASLAKSRDPIDVGFVRAILAFHGDLTMTSPSHAGGAVTSCLTDDIPDVIIEAARSRANPIQKKVVVELLRRLQLPPVQSGDLGLLGFTD